MSQGWFRPRSPEFYLPLARAALIALLYFLVARASRFVVVQPQNITPIWPPSGLLLAALLLIRSEEWPLALGAAFGANLLANLTTNTSLFPAIGFSLVNCTESGLAALLVQRQVGPSISLGRLREVVGFAAWAALGSNALTALLGAAVAWLAYGAPFWNSWLTWWIADGLGMILIGSLILTWAEGLRVSRPLAPTRTLELLLIFAGAIVMAGFTFGGGRAALAYPYQILPFMLWAALRFGPRETTTLALVLSGIVLWNTVQGFGPFAAANQTTAWHVLAAQGFLVVVMLSALILAALMQERAEAREELQHAYGQVVANLANSQAQLASIIGSAMDAIITVSEDQRVTMWNSAAERIFGYPALTAIGQPLDRFIPRRFHAIHREHIRHFGSTGTTTRAMGALRPLAALRADGAEFPIEASISQVTIGGQKLYTVILRDITTRVDAETALRNSEERFSKAFQSSPVAMVISTVAEGLILDVNDHFLKLFEHSREDVIGRPSLSLNMWTNPADREHALEMLGRQGVVRDFELLINAAGGEARAVLLSADIVQLSGEPCIITTLYDISARKAVEEELYKSRQQLQSILDNAPALISLKEPDGHYILVNRRFETLLQRDPIQIIGRTDADLFPQEIARMMHDTDLAVIEQGLPVEVEHVVPHPDGFHTYSAVKFPLTDLSGESYALCSIATDVTERLQLQSQLIQSQKMESIGQLAGGIAHDFNNLLTAISGYTELAMGGLPPDDPVGDDLHEVLKASARAASLTRQLLAFARRQRIEPVAISINTLIADIEKLLRRLISEDIELVTRLAANVEPVRVDPGQIEQVLINLVVNARDAMPNGGQITIETANVMLDPRYAHGHLDVQAGTYVMFVVSDTGIGMSHDVQTHVFEPFYTTKEPGKGTGLGLSTCYGIVKQHNGTIWIYSEPGHGTSVKVYLPPAEAEVEHVFSSGVNAHVPRGNETILVVEDEPAVRDLAVRILGSCGYRVLDAANGIEALRLAQAYRPAMIDLLLTDIVMPQMGGGETATQMRSLYPMIKIIYMSGYTEHATLQRSNIIEGMPFIQKPFTASILAHAVRSVLDEGNARVYHA